MPARPSRLFAYPRERFGSAMPTRGTTVAPRKSIFDPVHGPIALDGAALALIGTPEFQRLWGIRQTGFAHLVFPGANHTRLEHSLGTYWVAGRLAAHLALREDDARHLAIGGLLHDLGHGPFSHTLDSPMAEVLGHGHERISRDLVTGADASAIPGVLTHHGIDPARVAELIDPPEGRSSGTLGALLHGAVDADRIDYLQRDAHYTGVAHGAIDAVRLLDTIRAVHGRLVFAEKGRSAVEGFLVGRALMYATVYYHKTVRAAEMMAQAAVERQYGFPDIAAEQFRWTDGELLVRLRDGGPTSAGLVRGLTERRLYKRAYAWRYLGPRRHLAWRRLATRPAERRALEDEIATRLHAPPGAALIDLAGLDARGDPADDWANVGLVVGRSVSFPFRRTGPWNALVTRAPADWLVSVYVAPRYRARASRWLERDPRALP
jgi:uncharacterized protein